MAFLYPLHEHYGLNDSTDCVSRSQREEFVPSTSNGDIIMIGCSSTNTGMFTEMLHKQKSISVLNVIPVSTAVLHSEVQGSAEGLQCTLV